MSSGVQFGLWPLQHRNATVPAVFESEGSRTSCSLQDPPSCEGTDPHKRACGSVPPERWRLQSPVRSTVSAWRGASATSWSATSWRGGDSLHRRTSVAASAVVDDAHDAGLDGSHIVTLPAKMLRLEFLQREGGSSLSVGSSFTAPPAPTRSLGRLMLFGPLGHIGNQRTANHS